MEYNPFTKKYAGIKIDINTKTERLKEQKNSVEWHAKYDPEKTILAHQATTRSLETIKQRLPNNKIIYDQLTSLELELKNRVRLGWNPKYWFSIERKMHSTALKDAQFKLETHKQHCDVDSSQAQAHEVELNRQEKLLKKYQQFDLEGAKIKINSLTLDLKKLSEELLNVENLKIQADEQLHGPLEELKRLRIAIIQIQSENEHASRFAEKITIAVNSYQRKILHEECGRILGDSNPSRVIERNRGKIERLYRNSNKLERRLEIIGLRIGRKIEKIVIDGSNLCYQQDGVFLGPSALQAAAKKLKKICKVIIVFDASIRGILKIRIEEIHALFDKTIEIRVVTSKSQADEILLSIANDSTTYVISNDRFADYPEKPVVRDGRIIPHEILDGKILIPELNVNEFYRN